MFLSRSRRRQLLGATLQGGEEDAQVPGVGELMTMCARAREVARMCELLGVGDEDEHHDHLEDHPNPPFIWDLPHA